ncbi:MAG: hypothetical protein PHD97_12745 [Bacteroidales bacterium]|nr:hypothetical protein [Bacteroidales bacterium]
MSITKEVQLIKQFEYIIGDSRFNEIIKLKISFIKSEFKDSVSIILIDSEYAAKMENVYKRAKIEWEIPEKFPRIPKSIMIDIKNVTRIDFLFAFLHECGHLKDYNNINIKLKTKRSEISAWKHAYEDLKYIMSVNELNNDFFNAVQISLNSYKVHLKCLRELLDLDLKLI